MSNPNDRPSNALIPPAPNSPELVEAFQILATVGETDVPRVPESIFREHLLPMLAAPAGTKVDLTRWSDIAGTPLRAIDVADDNTGEVLFRVPPLMRSMPTVFQQEVNYANIVVETQARENVHPMQADHFLRTALSKARTGATLLDVETAAQWNLIRQRYGLPLLPLIGPDGNALNHGVQDEKSVGSLVMSDDDDQPFF
jgi:hypothetical protein